VYQIKWDRILAVLLIILSPLLLGWLEKNIQIGPFESIPILGKLSVYPELKSLLLLAIILASILLILKSLKKP
jgi:hypothetical protein